MTMWIEVPAYLEDVRSTANLKMAWEKLENCTLLLSGASGLIGSFLVDVIMYRNRNMGMQCRIIALGRNEEQAKQRFFAYWNREDFKFISCDINQELQLQEHCDYVIHAASNTHPIAYATDPIGTVLSSVLGTNNLLDYAARHNTRRFVFLSSVEIYGQNRGDTEKFEEDYCGTIDCNTLRAGYPEGKRAGESLCQAYRVQRGLDFVIARLARTYGPGMRKDDSKAVAQFIKCGIAHKDIVLKSKGYQKYSYTYVADAVAGVLYVMLHGACAGAYNIVGDDADITLRELAELIAQKCGTRVAYEVPSELEAAGYSVAEKAMLDGSKIRRLGFKARFGVKEGC